MEEDTTSDEFVRRSGLEEFLAHAERELERLRHSDRDFDEALARQAVDLVVAKLKRHQEDDG